MFWLIIAGLLMIALLILVLPLLKKQALANVDGEQRNLKIARQQFAELKQQCQDGILSQSQFEQQYQELQQSFNDDISSQPEPQPAGNGRWVIPVLILLIPLLSLLLYFKLADPQALQQAEMQQAQSKNDAEVQSMIPKILERLQQNPGDLEGWLMLGRSYKYLEKYPEATQVFAKLYSLQPGNVEVILNYAECLAISSNGQLAGKPAELSYKALQLAPDNKDALWMAGLAKAEEGNTGLAISYWQRLAAQLPANSDALPQIQQMIAQAGQAGPAPGSTSSEMTRISVKVDMDASVKSQVNPEQTLFIYAQAANGPKMPLAIVRKQVADLPASVELNDSMAMQANTHLSDHKQLKIIARISKTGNASTQAGDFVGTTELNLPTNDQAVSVLINQEVK